MKQSLSAVSLNKEAEMNGLRWSSCIYNSFLYTAGNWMMRVENVVKETPHDSSRVHACMPIHSEEKGMLLAK